MLSFPFLFSLFSFLVTYLSRGTHSSAIVFSDGDDLGFNSDSGGGVGGGGLELDMDLDMDLDRDLMASSSMDDDDDDDSLFAMTNLAMGEIPASTPDDQPFSSFSDSSEQDSSLFALSSAPQTPTEIFFSSAGPNSPLADNDDEIMNEQLISLIPSWQPAPAPSPKYVPPTISSEEDPNPALLPNTDFNIYQSCHGKDIPGFQAHCDIVRCNYNNPYNPVTNNQEPKTDMLCCPPDPTNNQQQSSSSISPFTSASCVPYAPNLADCQSSANFQCCFTLFEPFVCDRKYVHLPSRWREPTGIEALDAVLGALKTEYKVPCSRWLFTLGVFDCEVEREPYYDLRCCEVENYGTF